MPLTILIVLLGNVFLLMHGAFTSSNNVTSALQRAKSAHFSDTLANRSQGETDFLCNHISLTDFFFSL